MLELARIELDVIKGLRGLAESMGISFEQLLAKCGEQPEPPFTTND